MRNKLFLIFLILLFTSLTGYSRESLQSDIIFSTNISDTTKITRLNINNISTSFTNNGLSDQNLDQFYAFIFHKDLYLETFYWTGFLWGGKIDGEVRVGGTTYRSGIKPAGDGNIYRVRRDYINGDVSTEIRENEGTEEEIRAKYKHDWDNWPASEGAPYEDLNNNGSYEPEIDIPGIPNADQTIWFKANDFDTTQTKYLYGSLPMGIELQATYWAYHRDSSLDNMIFRKYKIINRSTREIKQMYCSIFTDPDIGHVGNDYVGYDWVNSLAYVYNSSDVDEALNYPPHSAGFCLLKGPTVHKENIGVSSFNFYVNGSVDYHNPVYLSYNDGTLMMYNLFQGKPTEDNYYKIPDEYGGGYTPFPLAGDPVTGEGWLDGTVKGPDGHLYGPGNRNMGFSTGEFDLKPGEFQEIIYSQLCAGGIGYSSRFEGIDSLRAHSKFAKEFYKTISDKITSIEKEEENIPANYMLYQNYPNPFNPTTTIEYNLPIESNVKLEIYNSLGQLVNILVKGYQNAGRQKVIWNGKNLTGSSAASGIYFYRLQASEFTQTMKMIFIK